MNGPLTIRARAILPITGPPILDGTITIQAGRIVEIATKHHATPGESVLDLGNVAICPGFVNAHVHWEFSRLDAPLGTPGESLLEWIPRILAYRRETGCEADPDAVRAGRAESHTTGTAAAAEITQPSACLDVFDEPGPETIAFLELIGPTADRAKQTLTCARSWIADAARRESSLNIGLSPHAPYTVHPILLEGAVRLAKEYNLPLAIHYAESEEERHFLDEGTGPFRTMLERLDAWEPELAPRRDILQNVSAAPRVLIVHGTYLDETETAFLAEHSDTMSVVYCPRSTTHFKAKPHPLERLLKSGVRVVLGTDGRASAANLNMLDEMRFLATQHPAIASETILEMATLRGAEALGIDDRFGSLVPGKFAALTVIKLPDESGNPYEQIVRPSAPRMAEAASRSLLLGPDYAVIDPGRPISKNERL